MQGILSLTLVPAEEEIASYSGTNIYYCGLEITKESVDRMVDDMETEFFSKDTTDPKDWPRLHVIKRKGAGSAPEMIFSLAVTILSGTVSVAFFKILKLWISARNGRKVRVKLPNGFEVETSQLNHQEFCELFAELYSTYVVERKNLSPLKWEKRGKALMKYITRRRLTVMNEAELLKERDALRKIYWKKKDEISGR